MVELQHTPPKDLFAQQDSFSQNPAVDNSPPQPLRITKLNKLAASTSEPKQQWAVYSIPPSTSAAVFGGPKSPPPNKPLPVPNILGSTAEKPDPRPRKSSMSSEASAGSGSSARRRPHFDASDPHRPTAGYGQSLPPLTTKLGRTQRPSYPESPGGPEPPEKDDGGDDDDEEDGLFQRQPQRKETDASYQQQFYPPPLQSTAPAAPSSTLHIPNPVGVSRLSSTASTSTTRASRGSPPPPETPIDPHGGPSVGPHDIEARYAASGISGTNTLNEMQAQSAAAAARRAQYASPQPQRLVTPQGTGGSTASNGGRSWSPTERPGTSPHGPPIPFQGNEEVSSHGASIPSQTTSATANRREEQRPLQINTDPLQQDMARVNLHDEPPPAYSPPTGATSRYPNEKSRTGSHSPTSSVASSGVKLVDPSRHPAFANDAQHPALQSAQHTGTSVASSSVSHGAASPAPSTTGPVSPPPLPEGWIAHLDNNSGQYYYIHLPTQSTQWEFPKGPTPLNLQEPTSPVGTFVNPLASPVGSVFKHPLASPTFSSVPQTAAFDARNSMYSIASVASPTTAGFTGPPPSAGVDLYKIAPTNGVYFGPYLRYTNMDLERGLWLGSIMLITDASSPPTIHIHQSIDLSPNPRQLKANVLHSHQRWVFYRYDVDLVMEDDRPSKWTYAITSHLGCTRYEFLVAGRHEQSWRWIAHSGNDFEINVNANERAKLGGVGQMWKDVLLKHSECGNFHVQVGLGGQISADRLWKDIPALRQWTQLSGKENRKNAPWNAALEDEVVHAYFHYYTSHFDQQNIREAFAQIPHVCCLDDQDIFDGFGSYPDYMQQSNFVKAIGRVGIDMYLLFQHHTTLEILRHVSNDIDLFTITGTGWHFLKYFGPSVVMVGPDTRSERNTKQVMAGSTYQGLFPKVAVLPPSVQHCIWLFPVPLLYPRLDNIESIASTVATGKKVVTGGFNAFGKIAGGVAGIVGAKGVVNSGFEGVKKAMGKSGLMQGVLSPFGEIDVLDELRDMWTHESKVSVVLLCPVVYANSSRTLSVPTSSAPYRALLIISLFA